MSGFTKQEEMAYEHNNRSTESINVELAAAACETEEQTRPFIEQPEEWDD